MWCPRPSVVLVYVVEVVEAVETLVRDLVLLRMTGSRGSPGLVAEIIGRNNRRLEILLVLIVWK